MAEIILPPEENEETPQVPELNIDKPTKNSKVITIEFEAKKTAQVSTKDTNQQLYTTDTDAWFEFKETTLEGANGTYSVVFRNRHDGSIFQRTGDVVNGVAYYKIPHQEIRHAGAWRGQLVYTLENGNTTAREFGYDVKGHILDGKDVREIVVEDFETLMSQLNSMKDNAELELADLVNTVEQNESDRQQLFDGLVEDINEFEENERQRQENEQARESAESVRVSNEEERISKDSERDSKIETLEGIVEDVSGKVDNKVDVSELELYAKKEQEDWITPTLLNGATGSLKYRINSLGKLEFKGTILPHGVSKIAGIPRDHAPMENTFFTVTSTTLVNFKVVKLDYTGGLYFQPPVPSTNFEVDFNGIVINLD